MALANRREVTLEGLVVDDVRCDGETDAAVIAELDRGGHRNVDDEVIGLTVDLDFVNGRLCDRLDGLLLQCRTEVQLHHLFGSLGHQPRTTDEPLDDDARRPPTAKPGDIVSLRQPTRSPLETTLALGTIEFDRHDDRAPRLPLRRNLHRHHSNLSMALHAQGSLPHYSMKSRGRGVGQAQTGMSRIIMERPAGDCDRAGAEWPIGRMRCRPGGLRAWPAGSGGCPGPRPGHRRLMGHERDAHRPSSCPMRPFRATPAAYAHATTGGAAVSW